MTFGALRILVFLGLILLVGGCIGTAPVAHPDAPPADRAEAARGNNAFALDLYARLRGQPGNLFFSPASLSTALGMTYAGARGQTADEMAKVLHFSLGPDRLHPALGSLLYDLTSGGHEGGQQVSVANALWAQKGHPFLPEFVRLTRDNYGAGLTEVDFQGDTEQARRTINAWVAERTRDRIKDLLRERVLDAGTRLVLTNAIYFKGDWNAPFSKDQTYQAPFQAGGGEKVMVPPMRQRHTFSYLDGDGFQALELPYSNKDLSMVVFLPRKADGLADFEKTLTADRLAGWLDGLRGEEVRVALPRFKVTSEFSLKDTLSALGMALAFSDQADFSGLDGGRGLFITAVVHKAYGDVNEEGTEAAAATGVPMALAARVNPVFRADHPFVFLIRDRHSGSILFLGRFAGPEG